MIKIEMVVEAYAVIMRMDSFVKMRHAERQARRDEDGSEESRDNVFWAFWHSVTIYLHRDRCRGVFLRGSEYTILLFSETTKRP